MGHLGRKFLEDIKGPSYLRPVQGESFLWRDRFRRHRTLCLPAIIYSERSWLSAERKLVSGIFRRRSGQQRYYVVHHPWLQYRFRLRIAQQPSFWFCRLFPQKYQRLSDLSVSSSLYWPVGYRITQSKVKRWIHPPGCWVYSAMEREERWFRIYTFGQFYLLWPILEYQPEWSGDRYQEPIQTHDSSQRILGYRIRLSGVLPESGRYNELT